MSERGVALFHHFRGEHLGTRRVQSQDPLKCGLTDAEPLTGIDAKAQLAADADRFCPALPENLKGHCGGCVIRQEIPVR